MSSTLASSPSGAGLGTAILQADLALEVPTTITPGVYSAIITITAI